VTPVLWSAIGMAIGAVVLHSTLGLKRPLDRTYLSFACIMVLVAVFLYLQWELYGATSSMVAVEIKKHQVAVVGLSFACMFVFVPAYSRVRLPRFVTGAFWCALAIVLVANALLPYGLWFSGEPTLVPSTFLGEPYTTVITPPMRAPQLAFAVFVTSYVVVALVCAGKMYRRGERQRGVTFAIALAIVFCDALVDIIRDNVGGSWPYVAEYGIVIWALIVSVQLARDFRRNTQTLGKAIGQVETQARQLTAMLQALRALEHDMQRPLDALESGVVELARGAMPADPQLRRVERAVDRLAQLARSMPESGAAATRRAS
jgi:hypothetical protein